MKKPLISLIAAVGSNRELGLNNKLLWNIPEDMQYFKEKTMGHAVIMGQKTYESIGKPLSGRTNIVLSRDEGFSPEGCAVANSIDKALNTAKDHEKEEIFFIGGASVYKQSIDIADKLYLTLVDDTPEADVYFPDFKRFCNRCKTGGGISGGKKYEFWEMTR